VLAHDHTARAQLLAVADRELDALSACEAALAIVPDHDEAHWLRVRLLMNLKRHQEAAASCDALLARGRASAVLYELRGLARTELKEYAKAIEDFTQALALRPHAQSAPLLRKRGWLYLLAVAPRLALGDFDEAIQLEPSEGDAYAGRGSARVRLGQLREAVADAEQALAAGPATPRLYYAGARIYAQASIVATTEVRTKGQDAAALVERYQDRAAWLLSKALRRTPPGARETFWRDSVQADPALWVLRRRLRSWELAGALRTSAGLPPTTPYQGGASAAAPARSAPPLATGGLGGFGHSTTDARTTPPLGERGALEPKR
jgi:tetratricopeptide (TPR) repeat protein